MKSIDIEEFKAPLTEVVAAARQGVVFLKSGPKPVAMVTSLETVDEESRALSTDPRLLSIIEKGRAEIRIGKRHSLVEVKLAANR